MCENKLCSLNILIGYCKSGGLTTNAKLE